MIRRTHTNIECKVIDHRASLTISGMWECMPHDLRFIAKVIAGDFKRAISEADDVWFTTMLEL